MTDGTDLQPDSLTDLKPLIKEFVERLSQIESDMDLLAEDKKALFDEYSQKVDIRELKAAIRVHKIKQKVNHKDAFENILECLEDV